VHPFFRRMNATIMPGRVHYDALASYQSYDKAWLFPIAVPLAVGIVTQILVYADMVRRRCRRAAPAPSSAVVEGTALLIMLPETLVGVLSIVQSVVNYESRAFVGGASACDLQAAYSTYYVHAAMALGAYGMVVGAIVKVNGKAPLKTTLAVGASIHAVAATVAALPFLGHGSYLFAVDYCLMDVESPLFAWLALAYYFVCELTVIGALIYEVRSRARLQLRGFRVRDLHTKEFLFMAWFLLSWFSLLNIIKVYILEGSVYDTPQKGAYATMGMLVLGNQIVTPVYFGYLWRHDHLRARTTEPALEAPPIAPPKKVRLLDAA